MCLIGLFRRHPQSIINSNRRRTKRDRRVFRSLSTNIKIRTNNSLINSSRIMPTGYRPYSTSTLTLPTQRVLTILTSRNIRTIKRNTRPINRTHHPSNIKGLDLKRIYTRTSITTRNIVRRVNYLNGMTCPLMRTLAISIPRLLTIRRSTTNVI